MDHDGRPPAAPPASRRMPANERREQILEAAVDEFSHYGYQGATIARIAATAACSEPNLYKHFTDKRDLLFGALVHTESLVEAQLDGVVVSDDPLGSFLGYVAGSREYRRMLTLRMICSTLPDDDELTAHLGRGADRLIARFQLGLARGVSLGTIRPGVDAEHVAWTWLGLMFAGCYASMLDDADDAWTHGVEIAARYLRDVAAPAT